LKVLFIMFLRIVDFCLYDEIILSGKDCVLCNVLKVSNMFFFSSFFFIVVRTIVEELVEEEELFVCVDDGFYRLSAV
jgi:hypothetical protein